ncbi:hypothetical protein T484DRAFT_1771107 [Baffinella frigidus]|nr:hypothetical protein T484DRAFT_1771107 [Cryptophyta sp. CCMP2293]
MANVHKIVSEFVKRGGGGQIQEPVFEDTLPPTYETVVPQTSQAVVPDTDQTSQAVVPENSTFDAGVPQNSTFPAEDVDPPIHDVVPEMDGEVVPETALDTSVPSPPSRFNGGGWEGVADLGRFEDKTGGGNFEGKMGGENFEGKTGGEDLEGKTGGGELEGEMGDEHEDPMAAFLSSMG